MKTSFFSENEIKSIGFKHIGRNVLISRKASFYGVEKMILGDNVRIDDFCILSGRIEMGSQIHISAYVGLFGNKGIFIEDYSGISAKTVIYSAVDDFSGEFMVGPMIPSDKINIISGSVHLRKYSQIGAGCVVMPAVEIGEGSAVGAMSFVNKSLLPWAIYAGIPAVKISDRSKNLINLI